MKKGERIKLDGGNTWVVLINREISLAYVNIINQGLGSKCAMVKVNLKDGKIQVIASESCKPVVAPDGMTWVRIDIYGLQIYTQGLKSYRINVPNEQGYSCFSP